MSIKIILADDHNVLRAGLRTLLEQHDDIQVIAEAEDGRTAVRIAGELSPDIVVIDVSMPNLNGIEATRQIIAASSSQVKVIALSMHSDEQFVTGMFEAGASGYLLKGCNFEELIKAIRVVAANQAYISPSISNIVINGYINRSSPAEHSISTSLTAREREVLQLLAEGSSTKEIASQLFISIKTVEAHRQHIMDKLNLHNLAELTKYAIRKGLTSL